MHSFDRTMLASLGFNDPDKGDPRHDLACGYLAIPENQLTLARRFSRERLYCHAERDEYIAHLKANTDPTFPLTQHRRVLESQALKDGRPTLEYVISKGTGQYKTTVGFVDLRLKYAKKIERPFSRREAEPTFTFTYDDYYDIHMKRVESLGMTYEEFLEAAATSPYVSHHFGPSREHTLYCNQYTARRAIEEHQASTWVTRDYVHRDWKWSTLNVEVKANPVPIGNVLRQVKLYAEYVEGKWLVATTYPLAASDVAALNACEIGHVQLGDRFAAWAAEQQQVGDHTEAAVSTFTL